MNKLEESDYYKKRHILRESENKNDPWVEAHTKRKVLVTNYHSSISLTSNATTCRSLEDDLNLYASVVDSRSVGQINNYTAASTNFASHCKSESKEWKSHLYKQTEKVNSLISKLKCQTCSQWEPPQQLSKLFSEQPGSSDKPASPPRVRKHSDKGPPVLIDFPKLILPKEVRNPNVSVPGNIHKLEGSTIKPDIVKSWPDFPSTGNTSGKSLIASSTPEQASGRINFNSTIKSNDEPYMNLNMPRSFLSNASDAGCNWNVGNLGNTPKNFQSNFRKDFPGNVNNYNDGYGAAPPGSDFERNGRRGGGYHQRVGRGYCAMGTRKPANDDCRNYQESSDAGMSNSAANFFKTARDELVEQNAKKNNGCSRGQGRGYSAGYNNQDIGNYGNCDSGATRGGGLQYGANKRSLGTRRGGGVFSKFIPPVRPEDEEQSNRPGRKHSNQAEEGEVDERLKNIDPKMIELIRNEIMDISAPVRWDDIAGLEFAKATIQEIVVWPMMRPDIFTGLRKPPKGLLLFGPPGTGKTLIGKCIASQSESTFFSISASSLTSKWIGDGEKMVRALFAVAKCHQPAVVFIDEIDSLLTQRSDTEHESSRRIKTEFLVQLDGAGTGEEERILVIGATNRPQELDEAARRRLVKRLYIPLPEFEARKQIVERLMSSERNQLTPDEINEIAKLTDGYSGADMKNVCQEASLGPIRSLSSSDMHQISAEQVRPVNFDDFKRALQRVRASVSQKDLDQYVTWDQTYGMSGAA